MKEDKKFNNLQEQIKKLVEKLIGNYNLKFKLTGNFDYYLHASKSTFFN